MLRAVVFQALLGACQSPVKQISLMEALTQRVTLARTEAERLQNYLGTLSPAAWHHPSACAGWEVGDVVAHLEGHLRHISFLSYVHYLKSSLYCRPFNSTYHRSVVPNVHCAPASSPPMLRLLLSQAQSPKRSQQRT